MPFGRMSIATSDPFDICKEATMAKGRKSNGKTPQHGKPRFRSQLWFDNPDDPGATALYFERYLNYGLTRGEIMGGKPIIGICLLYTSDAADEL